MFSSQKVKYLKKIEVNLPKKIVEENPWFLANQNLPSVSLKNQRQNMRQKFAKMTNNIFKSKIRTFKKSSRGYCYHIDQLVIPIIIIIN